MVLGSNHMNEQNQNIVGGQTSPDVSETTQPVDRTHGTSETVSTGGDAAEGSTQTVTDEVQQGSQERGQEEGYSEEDNLNLESGRILGEEPEPANEERV